MLKLIRFNIKLDKLNSKKNKDESKIAMLTKKAQFLQINETINKLEIEKEQICKNYEALKVNLENTINKYLSNTKQITNEVSSLFNDDNFNKIDNKYYTLSTQLISVMDC